MKNYDVVIAGGLKRGGAERVTVRLAEYFAKHGNKVAVVTSTGPSDDEYQLCSDVDRYAIRKSPQYMSTSEYPRAINEYHKLFKRLNPKLVLIMSVPDCWYIILSLTGIDTKVVVSERNDPRNFPGKKAVKVLSRTLMKKADGFVFQTDMAKNFYSKKIGERSCVIPNPIPINEIPTVDYQGTSDVIVTMGRLQEQKNHKMLIDAFHKVHLQRPEVRLHIYGEGRLREVLEDYIYEKGLNEVVTLKGNHLNVLNQIKDARMFVLSSNYEGMPNALMEALTMGLPCISTDCPCGGPKVLINDGVSGILVPVDDSSSMSEAILSLLQDNSKCKRMAETAKAEMRERFNIDVIGNEWMSFIKHISSKK